MANPKIILDTNIFIDHLRKVNKENSILTYLTNKYTFSTTSITIYELFTGCVSKQHYKDVEKILFGVTIFDFDNQAA
ncbi:type II toxin-antitoxin system VapC family toxin [candidate division KSB1 bacterium]|nr:type II toxin-antitoxin system VapC family toxin [candidate division KSB1 bacterium]MBL7093834.1 type II toxin-antitoxin system VapC family toxin [candidate division KSB1 bacterium]